MVDAGNINAWKGATDSSKIESVEYGAVRTAKTIQQTKEKISKKNSDNAEIAKLSTIIEHKIISILNNQIMTKDMISSYLDIDSGDIGTILDQMLNDQYIKKGSTNKTKSRLAQQAFYTLTIKGRKELSNRKINGK